MYKVILSSFICCALHAADLGFYGHTFPVSESNLVELLEQRFSKDNQHLDEKLGEASEVLLKKRMHRPSPVEGLTKTNMSRTWKFDPTIKVSEDLLDKTGKVLVAKGTPCNPLENGKIQPLIFFDGDDPEQLDWANSQDEAFRWVLTNGDPLELARSREREVFFDQFGSLTRRFGIKALPAKVSQEGNYLMISEEHLKEDT